MINNRPKEENVWEKRDGIWQAIFYFTIFASVGLMLRDENRITSLSITLSLTFFMLIWHWGGMWLAYKDISSWEEHAFQRFIIILGDIILWFLLVNISPAYYLILFGLFLQVFRQLPIRYAVIATIILTTATIFEQLSDSGESFSFANPIVWVSFSIGLGGTLLGIWISAIIKQSTERSELIKQLETTQAELAAAERREGILEERERLASEIHDTIAQGFTSIVMLIESAELAILSKSEKKAVHNLGQARDTARNSLEQARRLVWELRPEPLENASLPDALDRVCRGWELKSGLRTIYKTTGQAFGLHPEMEIALLRALQEALHNVEKHAKASAVNVTLSYMGDVVMLDVIDNGLGFSEGSEISDESYGLIAMRERAKKLGGKVLIESELNIGTTLSIKLPIRELE